MKKTANKKQYNLSCRIRVELCGMMYSVPSKPVSSKARLLVRLKLYTVL